jgi:hypothetical protein
MHQSAHDVIRILRPTTLERLRNINNELGRHRSSTPCSPDVPTISWR